MSHSDISADLQAQGIPIPTTGYLQEVYPPVNPSGCPYCSPYCPRCGRLLNPYWSPPMPYHPWWPVYPVTCW
jgi:hypothetical protein